MEYRGSVRQAIHRFKYANRRTLGRPLSSLLRYAWDLYPELRAASAFIPVPLHSSNERLRGYNQAEILAREMTEITGIPTAALLERVRKTRSQFDLDRAARKANVEDAFRLHPALSDRLQILKGRSFVLIDDVCTTGSTLVSCARPILAGGCRSVSALVLARDL